MLHSSCRELFKTPCSVKPRSIELLFHIQKPGKQKARELLGYIKTYSLKLCLFDITCKIRTLSLQCSTSTIPSRLSQQRLSVSISSRQMPLQHVGGRVRMNSTSIRLPFPIYQTAFISFDPSTMDAISTCSRGGA